MKYEKKCPDCGKILTYTRNYTLTLSIRENWKCKDCCPKNKPVFTPEKAKQRKKESNKKSSKKYCQKNKEKKKIYDKEYTQKPEIKLRHKKYYQQKHVKNKKNIYMKEYGERHEVVKRIKEYRKEYSQRPESKKKRANYENNRRKNSLVKLYHNFSTNLRGSLKRYSGGKLIKGKRHWEDIVGYSVKELKVHLENLFQPGMTWDNHGEWHIDHIIPASFFVYSSMEDVEFKYCWSLLNLQPLWAKENLKKSSKISKNYLVKH